MTIFTSFFIGVIPVVLLVLAGLLIQHTSPEGAGGRRLFVFWVAAASVFFLAVAAIELVLPGLVDGYWLNMITPALLPAALGAMAMALTRIKLLAGLSRPLKILVIAAGGSILAVVIATWARFGYVQIISIGSILLALLWGLGHRSGLLAVLFSLLSLAGLALLNSSAFMASTSQPTPLRILLGMSTYYVCPALAVISAALLISAAFKQPAPAPEAGQPGPTSRRVRPWVLAGLRLGLAAALLGALAYTIFWLSIWDQTSDGLSGSALLFNGTLASVAGGMFLGLRFSGKRRALGLAFAVLVPALLIAASSPEWMIYKTITSDRAASIQAALERYRARSSRYPASLAELVPVDMLWVPGPVIQRGEDWCYQGGPDFYRLGAVYREFFGMPVSVRIYASAGTPTGAWDCESRLALYPAWNGVTTPPPLVETPMPTSAVPIPPTVVEPRFSAGNIQMGTWSPDSASLVYARPEDDSAGQHRLFLSFLDAKTGAVCDVSEPFPSAEALSVSFSLRVRSAWLPDGRLLFLSPAGDLLLLKPCQAGQENLTARYPQAFQSIVTPASKTGRVLLKSKSAFWILDGASLEALPVSGATPNPFELHWDNCAWSPDGSRLAISRLNGETKKDGSTLFLVDAQSGNVLKSLPLPGSSDQSAPMIEWENSHVLLSSLGEASVLFDFSLADPLKTTNVLKDLFSLDVTLNNVSTWASVPGPATDGYHLVVRVDHPRNQAVYLYHSETGTVEVLHPEAGQLLVFPDGQFVETVKMAGTPPPAAEKMDVVWVDAPGKAALQIPVQGHSPRNDLWLRATYLPSASQLVLSSSQGISLVALPGGELLRFWSLAGRINNLTPWAQVSPDGRSLAAAVEGTGLYFIPIK